MGENWLEGSVQQAGAKSLRQALRRASLFPIAVMAGFWAALIIMSASLIMREITNRQRETADALAGSVENYLLERGRALETLASTAINLSPEQQKKLIETAQWTYPSMSSIYLLDREGRVLMATGSLIELEGIDLSGEVFFQHAPENRAARFSPPFVSLATGRVTTTASVSVMKDSRLAGSLVAELDLGQLQAAILDKYEQNPGSITFLVDQEGVLVAHPEQSWVQEQRNMADLSLVRRGLAGESTDEVFYNQDANAWYIGSAAVMPSGWVIVTMQPVMLAARSLLFLLAMAAVCFSAGLLFVLRLEQRSFRRLANPILYLSEQADAFSGGKQAVFDPARMGGYHELINLGDSLAHMVQAVEDRTRSLEESWKDYSTILNAVPEFIWYVDKDLHLLRVNRAALNNLQVQVDEVLGKSIFEVFSPESAAGYQREILTVIQTGEPALGVIEPDRGASGEPRWLEIDYLPYLDGDGKAVGAIIFAKDITDRKQAEEDLERYRTHLEELVSARTAELHERVKQVEELNKTLAGLLEDLQAAQERTQQAAQTIQEINRELEAFAYTVSHDLRAPLRHINAYTRLLAEAESGRLEPSSIEMLDAIKQSVARMDQLIEDLLAFSRTGRAEMTVQPVDLNLIIDQARRELEPQVEGRCIIWQVDPLPVVSGDSSLLRQVWVNLLSNAIKFTSHKAEAVIRVGISPDAEAGMAALFVQDNGVGFDMNQANRLFGVFQRLHRVDEFEGTGIGLATVRRIVQRHGGRSWAEAERGAGATFYITLPVA